MDSSHGLRLQHIAPLRRAYETSTRADLALGCTVEDPVEKYEVSTFSRGGHDGSNSGRVDRVIFAVEFARAARVERHRLDRLIFGLSQPGQHLQYLILPDIDGDRK